MKSKLLSIVIWFFVSLITLITCTTIFLCALLFFPFDKKRKLCHAIGYWWADAIIAINPYWNIQVTGLEKINKKITYVVVANHQSLADIVVLYKARMQFKWVAKSSLFKVPVFGWALTCNRYIELLRGDLASIKKVFREAAQWLRKDMSVLFFPEGTRSETGKLRDFQNGAFKLALKEKRPVLPICINGTMDAIPKGSWIFTKKVSGTLTILPPIDTSAMKLGDFEQLKNTVSKQLTLCLGK